MPAVKLLSTPGIFLGDKRVRPPRGKTSALLYYLAYQDDWVSRDDLLYLFWPDTDEVKARTNLRQLLKTVKKLPFLHDLKITPSHLRWSVETDVQSFRDCMAKEDWAGLAGLYRGSLLEGLRVDKFPEYESWLELERVTLFNHYREAVFQLCQVLEAEGRFDEAAEHVERLYTFELFDEAVFRRYLHYLKLSGRKTKAVSAYETFRETLLREFGAEPDPVTRQLIEDIRAGDSYALSARSASPNEPQPSLPAPATHFVGREREMVKLTAQLEDPACRLLTLVAPGGMGKTRVALEVAKRCAGTFEDGAYLIPFEAVSAPELMVPAVAESLGYNFSGQDPKTELLSYLKNKHMLLVLDNLEHLLTDTSLITDLLAKAPKLKLLATSREHLNLQAEWLFDLEGMQLPDSDAAESYKADSVRLFAQTAKKARASFTLNDKNLGAVSQVCRHVGGMPLALELAASWLRILSPQDILAELEEGLDILKTSAGDIPHRHLDIKQIFEASWSRLPAGAQTALKRLAVFEGGFTKEAAREVTGVGLPLLLLLVNKSFLRQDSSRRFTPHPLMWQFIRHKAEGTVEYESTKEQHAVYFLTFVQEREGFHKHVEVNTARSELNTELPNIRAAWQFATKNVREDLLRKGDLTLFWHFITEARAAEGVDFFRAASESLTSESLIHARILHRYGTFLRMTGNHKGSRAILERSLALKRHHQSTWDVAHALLSLGFNYLLSNYKSTNELAELWCECAQLFAIAGDEALQARALAHQAEQITNAIKREELLQQSLSILRTQQGYHELSNTLDCLTGHLAYTKGNYAEAALLIDETVTIERQKGNDANLSNRLAFKGRILFYLGRLQEAEACFLEVLALGKKAYRDQLIMSLNNLVYLLFAKGRESEAETYLNKALELSETQNDIWSLTNYFDAFGYYTLFGNHLEDALTRYGKALGQLNQLKNVNLEIAWFKLHCLNHYGQIALRQGDLSTARLHFLESLELSKTWQFRPAILHVLPSFATLYLQQEKFGDAQHLLRLALNDSASMFQTKDTARKLLETLPQDFTEGGLETGEGLGLEQVILDILAS